MRRVKKRANKIYQKIQAKKTRRKRKNLELNKNNSYARMKILNNQTRRRKKYTIERNLYSAANKEKKETKWQVISQIYKNSTSYTMKWSR